jgi:hypothetical protein
MGRPRHGSFPRTLYAVARPDADVSRATERAPVLLGLLAGFVALALFGWIVGFRRVVATLAQLRLLPFSLGFLAVVGSVACQYLALAALLSIRPSVDSALAFLRGIFTRQLIPVGNVAGPVLIAYSMRRATGIPTDRGSRPHSSHKPPRFWHR